MPGALGPGAPGGAEVTPLVAGPRGPVRDRVLARLHQEGIAGARVVFADKRPRPEYLKLYHQIDLGLDPLPYNGHTTSLDAFWMGVPTLTLLGKTVVGRAGWSQLCNLGLKELAAETPEQFVAIAAQLAGDLPRLQELRGTLRERMLRSPLMDARRFARNVELAYRQIWRGGARACRRVRPMSRLEVSTSQACRSRWSKPLDTPDDSCRSVRPPWKARWAAVAWRRRPGVVPMTAEGTSG